MTQGWGRLGASAAAMAVVGILGQGTTASAATEAEVLATYADIAHAMYSDALATAGALNAAVDDLIANPSADSLVAARNGLACIPSSVSANGSVPLRQPGGRRLGRSGQCLAA